MTRLGAALLAAALFRHQEPFCVAALAGVASEKQDIREVRELSPSALKRFVEANEPVVIRGGARDWPALREWSLEHIIAVAGDEPIDLERYSSDSTTQDFCRDAHYGRATLREYLQYTQTSGGDGLYRMNEQTLELEFGDRLGRGRAIPFPYLFPLALHEGTNLLINNSSYSHMHFHRTSDSIVTQIAGPKTMLLLPPNASELAASDAARCLACSAMGTAVAGTKAEADNFVECCECCHVGRSNRWWKDEPLRDHPKAFTVTLNVGDQIFIPWLWYHATWGAPMMIGITMVNFWTHVGIAPNRHILTEAARFGAGRWQRKCIEAYEEVCVRDAVPDFMRDDCVTRMTPLDGICASAGRRKAL